MFESCVEFPNIVGCIKHYKAHCVFIASRLV